MSKDPTVEVSPTYQATVIDQTLVSGAADDVRLILTVRLAARLRNPRDPEEGSDPCEPREQEIWLTLTAHDVNRLRMTLRDLERLGFNGDDVSRLHPDHPEAVRLVGQQVHVRGRVMGEVTYWNLAWPRQRVGLDALRQAAGPLAARIAAVRTTSESSARAKP